MEFYKVETEPYFSPAPTPGRLKIKLQAGVALLTDFDTETLYLPTAQVVDLQYTSSHTAEIEHGLPVDSSLTKAQLQDVAGQLGLSTSGLKAEVLERILDHLGG